MTALRDFPLWTSTSEPAIVPGWVIECDHDLTAQNIAAFRDMWEQRDPSLPLLLGKGMRLRSMAEYTTPQMVVAPPPARPLNQALAVGLAFAAVFLAMAAFILAVGLVAWAVG